MRTWQSYLVGSNKLFLWSTFTPIWDCRYHSGGSEVSVANTFYSGELVNMELDDGTDVTREGSSERTKQHRMLRSMRETGQESLLCTSKTDHRVSG